MTDKEVHKLSRRELLQLLLAQVSETEELKQLLGEREQELTTLHDNYERLRKRLDQKDATIHELRDTMRRERNARRIELQEAGSIAEAALKLNGVFEAAQRAANQYLQSVRELYPAPEGMEVPNMAMSQEDVEAAAAAVSPAPAPPAADNVSGPPVKQPEKKAEGQPAAPKRSLRLKKQQEKGKLTLFFGWQHD